MEHPEVLEYPDSGKVGVMVGRAPGGGNGAGLVALFRRLDAVPYAEGEA
jgi:hypothetical protein